MSFTSRASDYEELLNLLREERQSWDSKDSFAECNEAIGEISGVGSQPYGALIEELRTYYSGNEERMLEHLRLTALAWPASDYGLGGAEWAGYFISERTGGEEVYATDRFADPSEWVKVEVATQALALTYDPETGLMYDEENWYLPDGRTVVALDPGNSELSTDTAGNSYLKGVLQAPTVADLRQTHFDQEKQRWRRWSDADGEFEHYDNEDGVWERHRGKDADGKDLWYRYHSAQHGWLRFDRASGTWLDPQQNQWRRHGDIGTLIAPAPVSPADAPIQPKAGGDPADRVISASMESRLNATVEAIRDAGVSADELSDEEIYGLFGLKAQEFAAAEIPEFQQVLGE